MWICTLPLTDLSLFEDQLRHHHDIDRIISAEIPDESNLYDIVRSCMMIHGPCGHLRPNLVHKDDDKCTKNYPKDYCECTMESIDGYR